MGLLNTFEKQTSNTVSIETYACYNPDVSSDLFYPNKSIFQYLRQAKWNFFWWTRVILYSFIILSLYASNLMSVSGVLLPCLLSHVSHFIWIVMLLPGFLAFLAFLAFHPLFHHLWGQIPRFSLDLSAKLIHYLPHHHIYLFCIWWRFVVPLGMHQYGSEDIFSSV